MFFDDTGRDILADQILIRAVYLNVRFIQKGFSLLFSDTFKLWKLLIDDAQSCLSKAI